MKDLNKIILIGRLGTDPVRRETKNGTPVTHFSLATSRMVSDTGSDADEAPTGRELKEETVWHNIVVWRRQAEVCAQFLRKGRMVYVEGSMRKRHYTAKDGSLKISFEVHAESVGFLPGSKGSSSEEISEAEVAAS